MGAKKDLVVALACIAFMLVNIGAIGSSGRRRAKEAVCLSNLHKWGTVFQMYLADNNNRFMQGWTPSGPTNHEHYWMEALRPYYGNEHNLRCCPEAATPGSELVMGPFGYGAVFFGWGIFSGVCGQPSTAWNAVTACDYGSYGMSAWACDPPPHVQIIQTHETKNNWRTINVAGADNIPLFTDNQFVDAWPEGRQPPAYEGQPWGVDHTNSMLRVTINRHNGSINSAFLDFSARKVPLKCLWRVKWHRTFDLQVVPDWSYGTGWLESFPSCE
ncbi:MAG: hypothetical protein ACYS21_14175 [Planctomycetota bacterium]|jgi:hypothetical protein